jgi:predicted ArsR family transcriptional regulator
MKFTRKRILDVLTNKEEVTARELSRAIGVTQADVRHHLINMLSEGLIVITGTQRNGRRGRPSRRFSLAAAANKTNFDLLSSALLSTTFENLDLQARSGFLQGVALNLIGEFKPRGPLVQRLVQAVSHLKSLGYQVRWEAHADAPRLILTRCPFAKLYSQHSELYELDKFLLEYLLGENVTRINTPTNQDGDHHIFQVGKTLPSVEERG